MCFKFQCMNCVEDKEYYAIKEGFTHRPIPGGKKKVKIENTRLIKDKNKYILKCKCPKCEEINTIELDEGQKNAYLVYTTEFQNFQNKEDDLIAQETLKEIRECCYGIITREMIERLNNNLNKLKKIKDIQVINKNIDCSLTGKEFIDIIESLMEEIK